MTYSAIEITYNEDISIHIPRVGDDFEQNYRLVLVAEFQSTSPAWGMTGSGEMFEQPDTISIHIPSVGDD